MTTLEADTMREAAQKMRDMANAVDVLGELTDLIVETTCDEFADFIASWDPLVARAVAEVLDDAAEDMDNTAAFWQNVAGKDRPEWARQVPALKVAQLYLGEMAE